MKPANRISLAELTFALALALALGRSATTQAAEPAAASPDVKAAPSCKYCGMDRAKFASTRMLIEYDDGTAVGLCSLHCAAIELANQIDKTPKAIRVGDYSSRELTDAEKATWVVGGAKPGVMSRRGKWAFARKADAEAFAKENGGAVVGFEEAIKAAYEDMYQDSRMIRERRKARTVGQMPPANHEH